MGVVRLSTAGIINFQKYSSMLAGNEPFIPFSATGGTVTTDGSFIRHTFTSSGTFQVTSGEKEVEIFVLGGGGAGPRGSDTCVTGGGSGYIQKVFSTLGPGSYTVTVGAGNGNASSFATIMANGGNAGAPWQNGNGGSGGGSGSGASNGGTAGTCNPGSQGIGSGVTLPSWLTPGAGGGVHQAGGFYAGGGGINNVNIVGTSAAPNTGGGGGGCGDRTGVSSSGGSGIVIVRFAA